MKILILSPHMDDAFLSLGGFIAKYSSKHELEIVDIFSYDPWVLEHADTGDKLKNINLRKDEEKINGQLIGVRINFLDYSAGWKEREYPKWQMDIDERKDKKIINSISNYIGKRSKNFDLIFAPLAIGGHVDHTLIRNIVSNTLPDHKVFYYEDLPYVLEKSFLKYSRSFRKEYNLLKYVIKLTEYELKEKEKFVRNYRSQLTRKEMEIVIKYTSEDFTHKENAGEIVWTYQNNIMTLDLL